MSHKQMVGAWLGAVLTLAAVPASAIDVDAFAQRIEDAGVLGVTYLGGAQSAGAAVVARSVGVTLGDTTYVFEGQFTFAGITMQPDGGYVVESITAPEIVLRDVSTRVVRAKLLDFSFTGYVVPGYLVPGKFGPSGTLRPWALHTGPFTWREVPMSIDALSFSVEPTLVNEAVTGVTMLRAAKGITFSLSDVPRETDAFGKAQVALGLDALTFDVSDTLAWQDTGLLSYSGETGFGEFGDAQMEIVANGVTLAKLIDIGRAWSTAQTDPLNAGSSAAGANPLLDLAIEKASFRYDAGRLLPQLLDFLVTELGGRDTVTAYVENVVMTELEAFDSPPLTALARPALRAFLTEPYNLEARIDPPAPVTFSSLSAATMIDEAGIVPLLGLSITANEPHRADAH